MSTPPPQVTGEDGEGEGEIPEPPTPEEQHAQHQDYKAAGAKIDDMLSQRGAKLPADMEVSFEKLVVSLYMQAMMQMGMIRDENGRLSGYVYVDVGGRDIGGYVADAKQAVKEKMQLPVGYMLVWSGQYENMERVAQRLLIMVPLSLFLSSC